MEFRNLKKQYQTLKSEIDEAVGRVLCRADFVSGKEVGELEHALSEFTGVRHCITCANGTDALVLALRAWNVGRGDAVFVPDFTFFSSAEAPALCGATPVFTDIGTDTFNMSPASLERVIQAVISEGKLVPKAVLAVDLFGQPADYDAIGRIARRYGLLLLEDGAQGFGGKRGEKRACSFGDIATTSFFPAKPLGCYGDGGALFTDHDGWAALLRSLCVHGKGTDKYENIRIGTNSRLDTLQAAVLLVKLKQFAETELEAVNAIAQAYRESLLEIEEVRVPCLEEHSYSSWAQFSVLLGDQVDRGELQEYLKDAGIPTMVYYPKPLHEQAAFAGCVLYDDMCGAGYCCGHVLSLPCSPYMDRQEVDLVCDTIAQFMKKRR